jgi:hypothetical protein
MHAADEIEGMLAAQAMAAHHTLMECSWRAMLHEQPFEAVVELYAARWPGRVSTGPSEAVQKFTTLPTRKPCDLIVLFALEPMLFVMKLKPP